MGHNVARNLTEAPPIRGHFRGIISGIWGHSMLTDAQCRNARSQGRDYKLSDGGGLYLFVTAQGYRSWRMKYRFALKERRLVFGPYPEVSLAEARRRRDEARAQLRDGLDPGVVRKQRAAASVLAEANSFELIARHWHSTQLPRWVPVHAADVIESLEQHVFPEIGRLPITAITAPMILKIVRAIEARPAIETARRVRQRISAIFSFAIANGIAVADPAAPIRGAMAPLIKGRQPALRSLDQARALLEAVESAPAHPTTKLASRLLALTAVRPGVLRSTPWHEMPTRKASEAIWQIPAERMKLVVERKSDPAFDFLVPLSRQALEVIEAARDLNGRCPYVFPNTRHAHRPMSENAIGYMYNRLPDVRGRHVPHGWRATFSTIMNERAIEQQNAGDRAVIDLMLAHVPPGVEGLYNRAAYLPRRRELAQEWADMLLDGFPPASDLLEGPRR